MFHAVSTASYDMMIRKDDGTQDTYLLRVMQSANLPSIFISTANNTMDYINDKKGNYEPGYFVCIGNTGDTDCERSLAKVKLHGFTSLSVSKKTYQIDFSEAGDLLDMGSATHWILQANAYDKSYMRNKLVYDMFQCMESDYAIEGTYADVYFNNEYAGNYLICEKVEAGLNRIEFSDSIGYNAEERENPGQIVEEEDMRYFDLGEQDTDRGYLIETQNLLVDSDLLRMSEDDCFFVSDSGRYEVKWPEEISKTQIEYIREYMQQIEKLIYCCDTDRNYHELDKYIDMDSFAVMYLMNILTNDVDANAYSTFYYKLPENSGGKLYAGPVWDYDRAFGNEERNVNVSVNGYTDSLCEALYKNAQFRSRVQELFNERFIFVSDNVIQTFFETIPQKLSQSVDMDSVRWQNNLDRLNYSYNSFEDETAYLKYYYDERMRIVNEIVNKTGVYHTISFVNPEGRSKSCFIKDGELLTAETLSLMRIGLQCDTWTYDNGKIYQQGRPIFGDMILYGRVEDN